MIRKPLVAVLTAAALVAPVATFTSPTAAAPAARASRVVLASEAGDVWLYSEDTSSWEFWGTKADADVLSATVNHGEKTIRVVMTFDNLRKKRPAAYLAKIRTDELVRTAWVHAGKGPGWAGRHGLQRGMDKVPSPGFTHAIDYQADTVVMNLPRKLLKGPAWIEVMMRNTLTGARLFTDNPHNTTHEPVFTERIYKP